MTTNMVSVRKVVFSLRSKLFCRVGQQRKTEERDSLCLARANNLERAGQNIENLHRLNVFGQFYVSFPLAFVEYEMMKTNRRNAPCWLSTNSYQMCRTPEIIVTQKHQIIIIKIKNTNRGRDKIRLNQASTKHQSISRSSFTRFIIKSEDIVSH